MKIIKLKDEYPWCSDEMVVEVTDEIAETFENFRRKEHAYSEKVRYHRAFYSLDVENGIEKSILFVSSSPEELYERKLSQEELYSAISKLPEKQAKRIYARFFLDMTETKIAKIEGVSIMAISKSISAGLKRIEKILKNF